MSVLYTKPLRLGLPVGKGFLRVALFSPARYLQRLSIAQKFFTIIVIVGAILIFEIAGFWFAMYIDSSIHSYVQGEGLWSKAQKESLNSLFLYSATYQESDYDSFIQNLSVPLGDRQARLELQKPDPNLALARQGFINGGNDPSDINGMIFLFQHFSGVSYMQQTISIWTQGDAQIQIQQMLGERIHSILASSANPASPATKTALKPLVAGVIENDHALTSLENQFSSTLGEASRSVGTWLVYAITILTMLLAFGALIVALAISRLLTQVDEAKSEFVALASHQLRSPLNVIGLSVELLKMLGPPGSEEEKAAVEGIEHEVEHMTVLIESILNVSRVELGSLAVEPRTLDVILCVKAEVESFVMIANNKGVTLEEFYDADQLWVSMDPMLMQVVLQNLLSNAIKYTSEGGKVRLEIEPTDSKIFLRVTDTGVGIPKMQQKYIFSKLFRAANARKMDTHGTGLGLYIVKSIVDGAGGKIGFVSEEGVGTTFTVVFPLSGMREVRGTARLASY